MDKSCILPFSKKGDLGIAKNYRSITLTFMASKVYNALLLNRIEPEIRNDQNDFRRKRFTTSLIPTICWIIEWVCAKKQDVTSWFVHLSKALDSFHRGKMEQILRAYGLPKETIVAIMMLYSSTKVKVYSHDRDDDFYDLVGGILLRDTLASYLFIISLD